MKTHIKKKIRFFKKKVEPGTNLTVMDYNSCFISLIYYSFFVGSRVLHLITGPESVWEGGSNRKRESLGGFSLPTNAPFFRLWIGGLLFFFSEHFRVGLFSEFFGFTLSFDADYVFRVSQRRNSIFASDQRWSKDASGPHTVRHRLLILLVSSDNLICALRQRDLIINSVANSFSLLWQQNSD